VVAVEALVEPGLLELVVAHQPVPELVAALVDGDALRALERAAGTACRAAGEEVGYSIPPEADPQAGSTTVIWA
jgi:hypothetical protein